MKGLTKDTSKTMLRIKGKPLLEHKILMLPRAIKEIVFVIGYQGDDIIRHFKRYFDGRRITYVFQTSLTGTGGALHLARSILRDKFMVMMGDDLYHKKDLNDMLKEDLAIMGYEVEETERFGVIKTDKKKNMIDVIEKPKNLKIGLANTGVYMLNKKFFDYELVPIGKGEFGLPQTMAKMARDHKIKVNQASLWHPIGNPDDLKKAEGILHKFM